MSFVNLATEMTIRFQIGEAPPQMATLMRAPSLKAFKIDGRNLQHFFNAYRKKHACVVPPPSDAAILDFCFVPAGFRQGDSLTTALACVEPELLGYLGHDECAVKIHRHVLKVAGTSDRARQASYVIELMRMLRGKDEFALLQKHPSVKTVVVAKCNELYLSHHAEFPEMGAECREVLRLLGEPADSTVLKNWQLLPAEPLLVTLEVGEHGGQDCLLFANYRTIYSTYYRSHVHLCRHFNRYMKVVGEPMALPFVDMLKHYYVDKDTSLYDFLLHWQEGDTERLTFCSIAEFQEQELPCNCNACLRQAIRELQAKLRNKKEKGTWYD